MGSTIALEKVQNLRDLGGLPTDDGRRVVAGRLFRSGSLHQMTTGDRVALETLGIRLVLDLRSAFEQQHQPYEWPGGRHVAAPLAGDEVVADIFRRFQQGELSERDVETWWQLTGVFEIPREHRSSLRTVFASVLEAGADDGVLFHCSGGKDRTGVVAALLLEALGVAREAIRQDFLAGNADAEARAAEFVEWMRRAAGRTMSPQTAYWLAAVKGEWLDTFFDRLTERYGSVRDYLCADLAVGPAELATLQNRYLVPLPRR